LRGNGKLVNRPLYWHYPHYQHYQQGGTTPYSAVRDGDYRLVEFLDDSRVELYNLREDPAEQHNIAEANPEITNTLRDMLHEWRKAVNAQMPTPNPNYDPTKPEHTPTK
jgi:arylsulfatase A-like enzyme